MMRRKKRRDAMEEILALLQPWDEFAIVSPLHLKSQAEKTREQRKKVDFSSTRVGFELS